ncbi:glutathione synthase [Rhabdaerophilum sp. SD176]|uniref:glutathione synthase n=1 Tax=Rhabdaerophilum sp. SD176 TaxID=2983548 RepID=UPI0024DF9ECE|nr:glutathione synthase [Rhabdaerophilum sp. SD176]
MALKIAVQMDPIEKIKIAGDSTFALMLEAQARGHSLHVYGAEDLTLCDNHLTARMRSAHVRDVVGDHVTLGGSERFDVSAFDVVLMRQDPPFDLAYITASHLLERVHPRTLVVNDPAHVRNAPEKILVTEFPDLMPPTLISRDRAEIEAFRAEHGDLVMKPLYGNGGAGVFKVARDDLNFNGFMDHFAGIAREPWMIQRFLPAVHAGDKRIILVDGVAMGGVNRVPAAGDIRSNLVRGGAAESTDFTPREREICERIGPLLRERGLIFVGIDVIDGNLTEINVTSPTGIRAIKRLGGPDLAVPVWDAIERRLG